MGEIFKINKDNISYEEMEKAWEECNNERLKLQRENILLEADSKHWRLESEKCERFVLVKDAEIRGLNKLLEEYEVK